MKIVNIMNFARSFEPRRLDVELKLLDTTRQQLDLVNEFGVEATFLLQYDVFTNDEYVKMIKERAGENIELGLWYEIVEPLTTACGMKYESERGWKWDWFIKPGFSMSYSLKDREVLIDEAMRKFREVFGYYPRTVGSWIIDTYTINYLTDKYDIDAVCYCRDQINTDAYTLVGGYFNQAYYPSKNNMFTPAQTEEMQGKTPMIRLLGSDPIHNYDNGRFASPDCKRGPYTMELAYNKVSGGNPDVVDWYLKSYFENEDLGFSYMQIGQENSFAMFDLITPLRMQIEKVKKLDGVVIEKMCDTGRHFKKKYKTTPATAVCSLDNWDTPDCQSVFYDSAFYTANIFRHEGKVFIRALYLFDERIKDTYLDSVCTTFDSVHENLPIVDTAYQKGDTDGGFGIILDDSATTFSATKTRDSELTVAWGDKKVTFKEDSITLINCKFEFTKQMVNTALEVSDSILNYEYKNKKYALRIKGASFKKIGDTVIAEGDSFTLIPTKI